MKSINSKNPSESTHTVTPFLNENKKGSFFSPSFQNNHSFFGPSEIQPKLEIGQPDDEYEREADRAADTVMRMPDPEIQRQPVEEEEELQMKRDHTLIQRKCEECEEEKKLQKKSDGSTQSTNLASSNISSQLASKSGTGNRLPKPVRSEMAHKMGADFSGVNIHTGATAHKLNRQLGARAFTHGSDIYFSNGEYNPASRSGKHLLAHELTHVLQQEMTISPMVQKASDFCKAYATATEAADAESWLRNTYMRLEGLETFGTEVYNLYDSYLNRSPGDSLTPRVFDSDSSYIHNSFKDDGYIKDDMDAILELIGTRLHLMPGGRGSLRPGVRRLMSLSNFLSSSEMRNRPINFSNPFSVSGHIAGDIGSSDAGDDYRKIARANVAVEKVDLLGNTGYYLVELIPHYEVFDTIDFCPGNPGAPLEQWLATETMSRLEASGEAYDMPFKVVFSPEPRSERFWF